GLRHRRPARVRSRVFCYGWPRHLPWRSEGETTMNPAAAFALSWRATRRLLLACALMGVAAVAQAQTIRYDAATRVFRIDTDAVSYAFGVNENDQLQTLYWGARLATGDALAA